MRVVIDVNIWISFMLTRGETIASLFDLWERKKFVCLVTEEILTEANQVIDRFMVRGLVSAREGRSMIRRLKRNTELVTSLSAVDVAADKKDNRYLNCAIDGRADYLVTGDKKHLLPLKQIGKTKIVSPAEFVELSGVSRIS